MLICYIGIFLVIAFVLADTLASKRRYRYSYARFLMLLRTTTKTDAELADEFEAGIGTIRRWREGIAPRRATQREVIRFLERK